MEKGIDELLSWLRTTLKQKGMNTAGLAERTGISRQRTRKILAGSDELTVVELMSISEALSLSPADLSVAGLPSPSTSQSTPAVRLKSVDAAPTIDSFGNQPEQLFRVAFALGCDFLFTAKVSELANSGVPAGVLDRYEGREMSIKLDAAFHQFNEPVYSGAGIQLTLSFDSLYTCQFPWTAIGQVLFFPYVPEAPPEVVEEKKPSRPVLRLV